MADLKQIYASKGNKQFKPYSIAADAPIYSYQPKGTGLNTWGLKDTTGQEYYLTDGGNWRNAVTKKLSSTMPTYAAPTPAPAPVAPAPATPGPVNNPQTASTFKSIYDFTPVGQESLFKPMPQKSLMDYLPTNWTPSKAYDAQMTMGNQSLDRTLASRGLLGSGADVESRVGLVNQASQAETDRQMQVASTDMTNNISETNNLRNLISNMMGTDFAGYNSQMSDASANEITRDSQGINVLQTVMDYMKSLNPMQYGFPATNTIAGNNINLGQALSSLAGSGGGGGGSGGGGGGGGARPPAAPPYYAPAPSSGSGIKDAISIGSSIIPAIISAFGKQ
jgi:hypothetical protein